MTAPCRIASPSASIDASRWARPPSSRLPTSNRSTPWPQHALAGLTVTIECPRYSQPTWRGYPVDNAQIYPGWVTPEDHPSIQAAVDAYRRVVTPHVVEPADGATGGALRGRAACRQVDLLDRRRRASRSPSTTRRSTSARRRNGSCPDAVKHPPMFGIGAGIEQNTHRIGECVDARELQHAIAVLARFPRCFVDAA